MHYIPTAKMEAAILAAIQRVSWYVQNKRSGVYPACAGSHWQNQKNAMKECGQKVNQAQRRCKELDGW